MSWRRDRAHWHLAQRFACASRRWCRSCSSRPDRFRLHWGGRVGFWKGGCYQRGRLSRGSVAISGSTTQPEACPEQSPSTRTSRSRMTAFIVGLFVGAAVGFFCAALLAANSEARR